MKRDRLVEFVFLALCLSASCRRGGDPEYPVVPTGSFMMGAVNMRPSASSPKPAQHEVNLAAFRIGATEVTVASFEKFCAATKREMPRSVSVNIGWKKKDLPMVWVSADDARAYCAWAGGRLPTEAEWEYAARGGLKDKVYPWGDAISHENANYGTEEWGQTHVEGRDKWDGPAPVRSFAANGYGLFDMSGNVWEWVESTDGQAPAVPGSAAYRGGGFTSPSWMMTVSSGGANEGTKSTMFGFRCAKDGSR